MRTPARSQFDGFRARLASASFRRAELIVPIVLVLLAAPVGFGINKLDARADTVREADHLVRSIELDTANIRALEWKARALKGVTPGLVAEAAAADRGLAEHVDALARNGSVPKVTATAAAYERAYTTLLLSARTATPAELTQQYRRTVAPAERRLARTFPTLAATIDRSSETAQNRAILGTVFGLVALGVLVLLLALRVNRFRAAQIRTAEEGERRLHRAERLYRTLVERLKGLTYISALDGSGLNYVSPQLETLLGYQPDEWHDDPDLFRRLIHPDDEARVLEEGRIFRQGTGSQLFEYRMVTRDGSVIWIQDD